MSACHPANSDLKRLRLGLMLALGLTGLSACGDKDVETGEPGDTSSGGGDTSSSSTACAGSTPVMDPIDSSDSGYEQCADGTIHRVFQDPADPSTTAVDSCDGSEAYQDCTTDSDCTAAAHGACQHYDDIYNSGGEFCGCVYACTADSDCNSGEACVPAGIVETGRTISTCVTATCTTDDDCGSGECGLTTYHDGCDWRPKLACRTATDACRTDADCAATTGGSCMPSGSTGAYQCVSADCDIGRPLLVDEHARVAPDAPRADWCAEGLCPDLPADPAQRQALAARWRSIAALEHASVASFARFTLQLMALGAPAELLLATQQAAADEVEHAKLAYALASAYGGEEVGPGLLDLQGTQDLATDRPSVIRALVAEACVGETVGVAEARHRVSRTADPVVRSVLSRIAEDETRHATLAWQSLQWLVGDDPALRSIAAQALRGATAALLANTRDPAKRALRAQAIDEVVRPTAAALLAA